MNRILNVVLILCAICPSVNAAEEPFEMFLKDIIEEWQLRSPTVVVEGDFPELCLKRQWVLCLRSDAESDVNETSQHLAMIHRDRKQGSNSIGYVGPGHGTI